MRAFAVAFAFVALAAALSLAQLVTKQYSNAQCTGTEVAQNESSTIQTGTCILQNISRTMRLRTTITCNGTWANLQAWPEANTSCAGAAPFTDAGRLNTCTLNSGSTTVWSITTCSASSVAFAAVVVVAAVLAMLI
jgi:hypothetical protein